MVSNISNGIRSITQTIDYAAEQTCQGIFRFSFAAHQGVVRTATQISLSMNDTYAMEGFEKLTKAAISALKTYAFFTGTEKRFSACIKTLEAQKDTIYASLFINSTRAFIGGDKDHGYHLKLPRKANGDLDVTPLLMGIGNPLDTLAFIQKKGVYSFPLASRFSQQVGGYRLTLGSFTFKSNEVPVVKTLFSRPKDLFVFLSSFHAIVEAFKANGWNLFDQTRWSVESWLKLTGNVGKVVLIASGDYLQANNPLALTLVDVITQHSALIAFLMKREKERARF